MFPVKHGDVGAAASFNWGCYCGGATGTAVLHARCVSVVFCRFYQGKGVVMA